MQFILKSMQISSCITISVLILLALSGCVTQSKLNYERDLFFKRGYLNGLLTCRDGIDRYNEAFK